MRGGGKQSHDPEETFNDGGKEETQGGAANTKGFLRVHIKMYYSKAFIKYIHTWKKSIG